MGGLILLRIGSLNVSPVHLFYFILFYLFENFKFHFISFHLTYISQSAISIPLLFEIEYDLMIASSSL